MFSLPSFPGWAAESPWFLWNANSDGYAISPADHFMTASTSWNASQALVTGISSSIATLPAGFEHKTLLTVDHGIDRLIQNWGNQMMALYQKSPPSTGAGPILRQIGYWTDNGANYYYHQEGSLSYRDTLLAVKADFDRAGIQLGYMQLDSWFYPKGPTDDWRFSETGMYLYQAAPELFPDGLKAFQQSLGVPLVTHARWIDTSSPYRQQYQISGNVAIDPLYWTSTASYLRDSGVVVYEQDWMGLNAAPNFNLTDPDAFLNNMAAANAGESIDIQYCMATPRHFMHSLKLSNVTTARTSEDRFNRNRWTQFLYSGRLSSALGIFPFTDVFLSSETENLILAVMSAGPVGIGDAIGALNLDNLYRAVRADGVIVKPDAPLTPVDASYFKHSGGDLSQPMIATAHTVFDDWQATYIVGYDQGAGSYPAVKFSDLGLTGPGYSYDPLSGRVNAVSPGDSYPTPSNGFSLLTLAPTGLSGITVLGDPGQFASFGKQRIAAFLDDGSVQMTVIFAAGEATRTIHGVSPLEPQVKMLAGSLRNLSFNTNTHRFTIVLAPGAASSAILRMTAQPRTKLHSHGE
jgi:hypothetical protein